MYLGYFNSQIGLLKINCSDSHVLSISLVERCDSEECRNIIVDQCQSQLQEYLCGNRRVFSLPIELRVGDYDALVLEQLCGIGFGSIVTYGELASKCYSKSHARSVAAAVGRNPLLIVVPCHRVVAANSLGGFSAGIDIKIKLLRIEGIEYEMD